MTRVARTPIHLRALFVLVTLLLSLPGCNQDPAVTVTIEINGISDEADKDDVLESLKEMTGGSSHQYFSTTINDKTTIELSPVSDVEAFATKIKFGTVTDVDVAGRTVKVDFGP